LNILKVNILFDRDVTVEVNIPFGGCLLCLLYASKTDFAQQFCTCPIHFPYFWSHPSLARVFPLLIKSNQPTKPINCSVLIICPEKEKLIFLQRHLNLFSWQKKLLKRKKHGHGRLKKLEGEKNIVLKQYYRCNKVKQRCLRQFLTGLAFILKAESQEVELDRNLCVHEHIESLFAFSLSNFCEINRI